MIDRPCCWESIPTRVIPDTGIVGLADVTMVRYDIILRHGRLMDPASGRDEKDVTVCLKDGCISALLCAGDPAVERAEGLFLLRRVMPRGAEARNSPSLFCLGQPRRIWMSQAT